MKVNKDCEVHDENGYMWFVIYSGGNPQVNPPDAPEAIKVPCDCVKNDVNMRTVNEDWHYLNELDGFYD